MDQIIACLALLAIPIGAATHTYATDMRSRGINPWRREKN
jgi:hypothetical protein